MDGQQVPANQDPTPEHIRVLCIDDDESILRLVTKALSLHGCSVETAENGREGLRVLLLEDFDVLVVDLRMPEMDGAAFLKEALAIRPWLGVIMQTGFPDDKAMAELRKLGVSRFLSKPVELAALVANVRDVANEKWEILRAPAEASPEQIRYQLRVLRRLNEAAVEAQSLPTALSRLSSGLSRLLRCTAVGILGIQDTETVLAIAAQRPIGPDTTESIRQQILKRYHDLTGTMPEEETLLVNVQADPTVDGNAAAPGDLIHVPVIAGAEIRGIVSVAPGAGVTYSPAETSFVYHAADHLATVLTALDQTRELVIRDGLTQLFNREYLEHELDRVLPEARRRGQPVSLIVVDIDQFKVINESKGHMVADKVLTEFAQVIQRHTRVSDVTCRCGSNAFAVLLPGASMSNAALLAELLMGSIRKHVFCADENPTRVTASIGIAGTRGFGDDTNTVELLAQADKALYGAKRAGRNRVRLVPQTADDRTRADEGGLLPLGPDSGLHRFQADAKGRVMVASDGPIPLAELGDLLRKNRFDTTEVSSISSALSKLERSPGSYDMLFAPVSVLNQSQRKVFARLSAVDESLLTIAVVHDTERDMTVSVLRQGAYDIVELPLRPHVVEPLLERALTHRRLMNENAAYHNHLSDMVREQSAELARSLDNVRESYRFTLEALVAMLDAREHLSGQHSKCVCQMASILAREMGFGGPELANVERGALLHDIGKIGIPDSILLKPGKLTEDEYEIMKKHAQIGYDILSSSEFLSQASEIVYSHQERYDGTGYPRGLKGEDICLGARIFAVVDAYDAMCSKRVYGTRRASLEAVEEIKRNSGTQFDPDVVKAFLQCQPEMEALRHKLEDSWAEEP